VEAKQPPPATSRSPVVISHSKFSFGTTNAVLKTPIEPNVSKQKAAISTTSYTTEAATYKLPIKYPGSVSPRLRRKRNPQLRTCTEYELLETTVYQDDRKKRNANTVFSSNTRERRNANACDIYTTETMWQTVTVVARGSQLRTCYETEYITTTEYRDGRKKRNANTVFYSNTRERRNANACDIYTTRTVWKTVIARGIRPCGPCYIRNQNHGRCTWSRHERRCGK